MALNINGTTGISGVDGSVSAPAVTGTDSNTGITFPSADTIKFATGGVERMQISNSGVTGTGISNGKILQVLQVQKTDATSQATTGSANFFDISGLSLSITPSNTSNKILVINTVSVSCNNGNRNTHIRLMRGSTPIGVGTGGSQVNSSFFLKTRDNFSPHNISTQILDSPSTTSATTYKVQWSGENSDTFYLNRNASSSYGGNEGMVSTLTLMEVAA